MTSLRRFSYLAFFVACTHLVFGAIVRISGSGMGCGDHWPKCYGYWFPPLSRPDLIIEVSHRYLASILLLSLIALLLAAWRRRNEPGVGGEGGVLRSAALAVTLGFSAAVLGAVTVKLGNAPLATVAHWTVAMSLVATAAATVIRAGGLGGATARLGGVSAKTRRATFGAAAMALVAVVMGGLTAKFPGAAVACQKFPLCGPNLDVPAGAVHVQLTHRTIALLLILHLFGLVMVQRKRQDAPIVRRALAVALGLGVVQLLVAGAMIGMHLPPVLRSLHEAAGVSIWIATFVLAYLARLGSSGAPVVAAPDLRPVDEGIIRVSSSPKQAFASAVAEAPTAELRESWQADAVPELAASVDWSSATDEILRFAQDDSAGSAQDASVADAVVEAVAVEAVAVEAVAVEAVAVEAPVDVSPATDEILHFAQDDSGGSIHADIGMVQPHAPVVAPRSTMTHTVAVIVARGADL